MVQRATSLGPKPSLFFGFCFLFVVFFCLFVCFFGFCFFLFLFFWRVEGSGEVAQRATSLGPKPSLFFCFFPLPFLYLFLSRKTLFFPQKKAIFVYLTVFPFVFSLALFGPPPFFPFSFFVSLLLFSFFLPSCFFISLSGSFFFFLFGLLLGSRCYVVFLFLLVIFFLFWIIMFDLFLFCILFSSSCCFWFLLLSYFVIFWILATYQKHLWKNWKLKKKTKNEKCTKKGHFDKSN